MLEFFKVLLIILLIIYQFVGVVFTISIIDNPHIIPNVNKRKLAIILMGPSSWVISIFWFIFSSLLPFIKNTHKWFIEE